MAIKKKVHSREVQMILDLLEEGDDTPRREASEGGYWWLALPEPEHKGATSGKAESQSTGFRWVPLVLRSDEWEHFDFEGETLHPARWGAVVTALAILWQKPQLPKLLVGAHQGLPRGRCSMNNLGGYSLDHGNNSAGGDADMLLVAARFGIDLTLPENFIETFDPRFTHYNISADALKRIEDGLGFSLGLESRGANNQQRPHRNRFGERWG